jgi:hypothetical protein
MRRGEASLWRSAAQRVVKCSSLTKTVFAAWPARSEGLLSRECRKNVSSVQFCSGRDQHYFRVRSGARQVNAAQACPENGPRLLKTEPARGCWQQAFDERPFSGS